MIGALLAALGLGAVVFAWLLPGERKPRPVASLVLLRRLAPAPQPQARRRLPDPLPLALTAIVALALAGALHRAATAPALFVLVDQSASMAGLPVAAALEALRQDPDRALTLLHLPSGAVVSRDQRGPLPLLEAPAGADADPPGLVESLCSGETLLLTDRALPCAGPGLTQGPRENLGISAARLRAADALGGLELRLELTGALTTPRTLQLTLDGAPWLERPVTGPGPLSLQAAPPPGSTLGLRLDPADDLPADDAVALPLPATAPLRVTLVTATPGGFLARALAAHPRVALSVVAGPGVPPTDLLMLEGLPADRPAGVPVVTWGLGEPGALREPDDIEASEDPLLRYVSVEGLRVLRARALTLGPGDAALITSEQGPLAARRADGTVEVGFLPQDSDLPLRPDFVHLVANLVEATAGTAQPAPPVGLLSAAESGLSTVERAEASVSPWGWLSLLAIGALCAESLWVALRRAR